MDMVSVILTLQCVLSYIRIYIYIIKEKDYEMPIMPMLEILTCGIFAGFLVILPLQL